MEPKDLAEQLVRDRIDTLRGLGRKILLARQKPAEPPVVNVQATAPELQPVINVTVVVPPEAIKIVVEQQPANVTVNVPEQPPARVTVRPSFNVEAPQVTVQVPEPKPTPQTKTAEITHPDGSKSTVEIRR